MGLHTTIHAMEVVALLVVSVVVPVVDLGVALAETDSVGAAAAGLVAVGLVASVALAEVDSAAMEAWDSAAVGAAAVQVAVAMGVDVVAMAAEVARQSGRCPSLWWRSGKRHIQLAASIRVQHRRCCRIAQMIQTCCYMLCHSQLRKSTFHIRMAWR